MNDTDDVRDDADLEPAEALEELLEEIADALKLEVDVPVAERDGALSGKRRRGCGPVHRQARADDRRRAAPRATDRLPRGPSAVRIVIDANGYRARRAEALRERPTTPPRRP